MASRIPFKHGAKPIEVFDLDEKDTRVTLGKRNTMSRLRGVTNIQRFRC
jgi:hypothetical protein